MIDQQTVRLAGLNNRVPDAVLWLELLGAAVALACSALPLDARQGAHPDHRRRVIVSFVVLVTFDLDRADAGPDSDPRNTASGREGHDESAAGGTCTPLNRSTEATAAEQTPTHHAPATGAGLRPAEVPCTSSYAMRRRRGRRGHGFPRPMQGGGFRTSEG